MKKIISFLLIFTLFISGASAESPSITIDDLYRAPSYISIERFEEHPEIAIRFDAPLIALQADKNFSWVNTDALYLSDIIFITIAEHEEEIAEFSFPFSFGEDETVINVFIYNTSDGHNTVIEVGTVTHTGAELVNISNLPIGVQITMFVLQGLTEEVVQN